VTKAPIRVWLDDVRDAPDGWVRVFTAAEAIALLEAGGVVEISLDHDLGDEATCGTGYDVAVWIEEAVATRGFAAPEIHIHSANVVGRERMQHAIESIERLQRREPISEGEKLKIEIAPGVLDQVPESERDGLMEELEQIFKELRPRRPAW